MIPSVKTKIEENKAKAVSSIRDSILIHTGLSNHALPETGMASDKLISTLEGRARLEKEKWDHGNMTGAVYSKSEDLDVIHSVSVSRFAKANLLHPDVFSHTRQMEAEVIRMTLDLFMGDNETCGSLTMGGTESILLAMKAYRDLGKDQRGIIQPNIVVPSTAHAAFIKAGDYFGIEVRRAWCNPNRNFEVDLASMTSLIDSNTVALVGSCPQYPHGTIDPIPSIAALAVNHGIGCHVDACLGSFVLPFVKEDLPYRFDFSVRGVTSISCDTHKYGYSPKGSSVIMYKSVVLRRYQYSVCSDWEGGLYATPTILGSRCSSAAVAAWATMMYMGKVGYRECAIRLRAGSKLIERTILEELSDELNMLGRVDTTVISFTSKNLNIYDIAEYMKHKTERKWSLAVLQRPPGVHFAVTMANVDNCAEFSEDLVSAVRSERRRINEGGEIGSSESAVIYGSTASVPKVLVKELVTEYLDTCYMLAPSKV
jgi:sphinganine-1-phosphate aldolase